jgi:acyl-CoA synthetase (NDP forming)
VTTATSAPSYSPLDALLAPRSVAVVGASDGVTAGAAVKMGTAAIANLIDHGFAGPVYPVNPRRETLMGLRCYPSVSAIDDDVDLAVLVLPAQACVPAMEDCAVKHVGAVLVCSSGFAEAGERELERELTAIADRAGIRICGPNTAGLVNVGNRLTATISMVASLKPFRSGDIAFVSQSGALGGSMLGRGMELGVGFSHWVSTGNEANTEAADYLEYFAARDDVRAVAMFLEGIRDPDRFLRACDVARAHRTPVVVYKTGASEVAAAAALSHTGALAGSDRVFDAICRQRGLIRVEDVSDLFPIATALGRLVDKLPAGPRAAIVSASGGICGVGADECHLAGLEVPELSEAAQAEIRKVVPEFAAVRNPIDLTGQIRAYPTGYQDAVRIAAAQPDIDLVLLLITMAAEPRASFYGEQITALAEELDKPLLVAWTGPISVAERGVGMLQDRRVPLFLTVRSAVKAARGLWDYRRVLARE